MLVLGPLGLTAPWLLLAGLALPLLWLILRATPPAPRRIVFPATALLAGLTDPHPQARRTPLWLMLLRCAALGLAILAFAGPVWRPLTEARSPRPLMVVLDAGWAAAPGWDLARGQALRALRGAAGPGRAVGLLLADGGPDALVTGTPEALIARAAAAQPQPWATAYPPDPQAALAGLPAALDTLWVSDGVDHPGRADWLAALRARGDVTVVPPALPAPALMPGAPDGGALRLVWPVGAAPVVQAIGPDPQGILRPLADLPPGPAQTRDGIRMAAVPIDLPPELRNRISRFALKGVASAGAVVLADDRVRRRKLALVGDARGDEAQALLSPLHYLRQALAPATDLIEGGLADVLRAAPDVIVLVDEPVGAQAGALGDWVSAGGLLIRFAGPVLAADPDLSAEPLMPVTLRPGGRDIGGALSWGDPRGLAPFDPQGVFAGLSAPPEVQVRAQLMPEPAPDLAGHVLAALSDRTPLVTRRVQGQGQVVLFHVTANPDWSGLPISGVFVQMLDRLVASARRGQGAAAQPGDAGLWQAETVLDGFGQPRPPTAIAPVRAADLAAGAGPGRPAGIYAAGQRRLALNAGTELVRADWPGAQIRHASRASGVALRPWLLAAMAVLLVVDLLASAALHRGGRQGGRGGGWRPRLRGGRMAALLVLLVTLPVPGAQAQPAPPQTGLTRPAASPGSEPAPEMAGDPAGDGLGADDPTPDQPDPRLVAAAGQFALAFVQTGDAGLDEMSYRGLRGLSDTLAMRSAVDPGDPVAVDLEVDDLSLLTLLYWPVTPDQPVPDFRAYLRLNRFLQRGGVILFDTRDGDLAGLGGPDQQAALQALAAPLDVPPLAPVPGDHVLTRSFYLLQGFPGRFADAPLWAEAPRHLDRRDGAPFRDLNDGVSPVLIGGNAWADAWAVDDRGLPLVVVGRGLEGEHQREMAFRFGINLVMYVLTGNYKSDQVHVPALLDRLRAEGRAGAASGDGAAPDGPDRGGPVVDATPGGAP
ncbi:DUF4159 domain-containing protein [Paracoccus jiaweipingae]|uniref:DUF4159 domain-containing protein n=1 Tax=unclassified Paracoccus (in: a-proteobacteria) TaxID=2688777 RepID=UPI00379DCC91